MVTAYQGDADFQQELNQLLRDYAGRPSPLYFADLDEHISIEGLLAGRRSGESTQSFERWLSSSLPVAN